MDIQKRFGIAVSKKRKAADISQEELALRINADQAYVSRVESGEMNVTLETLQQFADALKIDPRELV